jgi:hypothetical protein
MVFNTRPHCPVSITELELVLSTSTKPCITPVEGMNAIRHKFAYNYTYICICDSLIIGKFGSKLRYVEVEVILRLAVSQYVFISSTLVGLVTR